MSLDFYPRLSSAGSMGQPSGFDISSGGLTAAQSLDDDPERWLINTPLLQFDHPKVRLLATRLTQLQATPRQKAMACFAHLRSLPFGAIADSVGTSSLSVLKYGMGDCHTKSTLMVALLRSSGIPARMRFVSLKPDFLHGIVDNGTQPFEHAMTEVLLDGRWLAVDSYVVDLRLAVAARSRLHQEGRKLGYGMHVDGQMSWDGQSHSFGQFHPAHIASMPLHDWGAFDDPYQFYSSVPYVKQRLDWSTRVKWMVGAKMVNRKVASLRLTPAAPAQAAGKKG